MAHSINTIKKRSAFLYVKEKGKFIRSNSFNIQILKDNDLNDKILVGYIATKRLGNSVIRNRAKRRMRELMRKVIIEYGKKNFYYVIIAKTQILKMPFKILNLELEKIIK